MDKRTLTIALAKHLNRGDFSLSGNEAPYTLHFADGAEQTTDDYDIDAIYSAEALIAEARKVRNERNRLLVESDSRVLPDRWAVMAPEQQAAWATYRQELRDLTIQSGFPSNVVWPSIPE